MRSSRITARRIDGNGRRPGASRGRRGAAGGAGHLPPSSVERAAAGKALRDRVPRAQHAEWSPPPHRRDPVDTVIEASRSLPLQKLVPIRYDRMMASPFAFYRGTANIMAADLVSTPVTGLHAQLCGDCHVLNFAGFATPERRVNFDVADFDETLPGPWEWDVKRLAASLVLAARSNGFSAPDQRDVAVACVRSYREHIADYADRPVLDVWYARVDDRAVIQTVRDKTDVARLKRRLKKAEAAHIAGEGLPQVVAKKDGSPAIEDDLPLIYHHPYVDLASTRDHIFTDLARYREALPDDRKTLLDRYRFMDIALKVVGIGSVGTFCAVVLMMAAGDDPLFLQLKEAGPSVLEPYVGKSRYPNAGQRVVAGQRLMQSASDIFLGWFEGRDGRQFYVRQLRDMQVKIRIDRMGPVTMMDLAGMCGWTLARAHARSADSATIAGYLGKSDRFDNAIARFGAVYADQAERDHAAFLRAIHAGRITVQPG